MAFKNPDHYKYIYELTDHLGSVRAIVTKLGLMATASMELSQDAHERQYFDNLASRHPDASNSYKSEYMAHTNPTRPIGPTTTLQVKAGDEIALDVYVKYNTSNFDPNILTGGIGNLLDNTVNDDVVGVEGSSLTNAFVTNLNEIMDAVTTGSNEVKAYIQYVLFDEAFNVVGSDFVSVKDATGTDSPDWKHLTLTGKATQNGYLYAYVVNESNIDVFFDDFTFQVLGTRVIRKTDYYPFGAVAKVWNNPDQTQQEKYRNGYQGQFSEVDTTTGWNAFELRMYDPLIGRFLQVDPERQFASGYVGMGNDPVNQVDPTGGVSTHTDKDGNVVAVKADGDLGVYQHNMGFDAAKAHVAANWSMNNTSAGGSFMGTTPHLFSFADFGLLEQGIVKGVGKIDFVSDWAKEAVNGVLWGMKGKGIGYYARNAGNGQKYDLKSAAAKKFGSQYYGSRLTGNVYASARDAGNFAAGMIQERSVFSRYFISIGFGTYNYIGNSKLYGALLSLGHFALDESGLGFLSPLQAPFYGEDYGTGLGIQAGFEHSSRHNGYLH